MALRIGTGGLKYPLPANTQAQQSIAAASSGGSAAASTFSANRQFAANKMRVQADLANAAADRDFRARSQLEGQAFRAQQEYYDREHQKGAQLESQDFRAGQAELDRNFDAFRQQSGQAFQENQAALDREFTTQRDQAQFERQQQEFDRQRDAGIEDAISGGKLELSPAAQAELDKLESGRRDSAKNLDPAQQAEFDRQYQARRREIIRTARPPQGPSGSAVFNQGTTWVDEETGIGYPNAEAVPGKKLVPYNVEDRSPLIPAPDTSKEDQRRRAEDEKRASDLTGEINPETKKRYTPKEASQAALDFRTAFESTLNSQETAPGVPWIPEGAAPGWQGPPQLTPPAGSVPPVQPAAPPSDVRGQGWYNPAPPSSMSVYDPQKAYAGGGNILAAPQSAAPPAGMADSVMQRSGADLPPAVPKMSNDRKLPEGMPAGAQWVGEEAIQLPDGRILRRKGK